MREPQLPPIWLCQPGAISYEEPLLKSGVRTYRREMALDMICDPRTRNTTFSSGGPGSYWKRNVRQTRGV